MVTNFKRMNCIVNLLNKENRTNYLLFNIFYFIFLFLYYLHLFSKMSVAVATFMFFVSIATFTCNSFSTLFHVFCMYAFVTSLIHDSVSTKSYFELSVVTHFCGTNIKYSNNLLSNEFNFAFIQCQQDCILGLWHNSNCTLF